MGPLHRAAYAVVSDRKKLTFEQAERDEALPGQLQPKEVSQELRAARWRVVFDSSETIALTQASEGTPTSGNPGATSCAVARHRTEIEPVKLTDVQ
jgi:hypothetical protein